MQRGDKIKLVNPKHWILEAFQNVFILIYPCEIYPYVYILFTWKANALEAAVSTSYYLLMSFYYFHRFSWNEVAVNLDPTVVLVWIGNIVSLTYFDKVLKRKKRF